MGLTTLLAPARSVSAALFQGTHRVGLMLPTTPAFPPPSPRLRLPPASASLCIARSFVTGASGLKGPGRPGAAGGRANRSVLPSQQGDTDFGLVEGSTPLDRRSGKGFSPGAIASTTGADGCASVCAGRGRGRWLGWVYVRMEGVWGVLRGPEATARMWVQYGGVGGGGWYQS
jgi:hypothetical protein